MFEYDTDVDETWNPHYYEETEAAFLAEEDARMQQLPWLTEAERSPFRLGNHPAYPGLYAEPGAYEAFAQLLHRTCSRIVSCQYRTSSFSVRGGLDVVSGRAYLREANRYVPCGEVLPDVVDIQFGDDKERALLLYGVAVTEGRVKLGTAHDSQPPRSLSAVLRYRSGFVPLSSLGNIIEALDKKGVLPPVGPSVSGKLTNQFHRF